MNTDNSKLLLEPIFTSDIDWQCNACLHYYNDPLELYAMGYKEAADSLVLQVMKTGNHQDSLVFPICFLYRQYIELRLKEIIWSGRRLLDIDGKFPTNHNIQNHWELALGLIRKTFGDDVDPPDFFTIAGHVVKEFTMLDPNSMTFRNPHDKKGDKHLQGVNHINLRRVAEYVNSFAETMEAASAGISAYLDSKSEMLSYCETY